MDWGNQHRFAAGEYLDISGLSTAFDCFWGHIEVLYQKSTAHERLWLQEGMHYECIMGSAVALTGQAMDLVALRDLCNVDLHHLSRDRESSSELPRRAIRCHHPFTDGARLQPWAMAPYGQRLRNSVTRSVKL